MKFQIKTEALQKKLSFISHAVSSKTQMPILSQILLEAKEDTLYISSTDLEIGMHTVIEAVVEESGSTTIPAKTITELIASLSVPQLTFETKENSLHISSSKTKNVLPTISAEEFPAIFEDEGTVIATLPKEAFQKELGNILFSASIDSGRLALSGIYIKKEENGFLLVATDGYRLSLKHYETKEKEENVTDEQKPLIIPARVFKELSSIKDEDDTLTIAIAADKNQVIFTIGNTKLIGRLIDAQFPPYERIIPVDKESASIVERESLLKAVKICAIFARDSANIIKFSLKKDMIIVSANSGTAENTVEVEAVLSGEENEIAFNAKYLIDVLSNVDTNELAFEMTGPLNPGVFRIKDDDTFLHLIMPIRVQA